MMSKPRASKTRHYLQEESSVNQAINRKSDADKPFTSKFLHNLFVPSYCLQGTEFQVHCEWDKEKYYKMQILFPEGIDVVSVDNSEFYQIIENKLINVHDFTVNGFLGIIFKANSLSKSSVDEKIYFKIIESDENLEIIEKTIHLFRPELQVFSNPSKIILTKTKDALTIDNTIKVKNVGEGTAIIGFKVDDDSELKIEPPSGSSKFLTDYLKDFHEGLSKIKETFNQYADLMDELILLGKIPFDQFDKDVFSRLEILLDKLNAAFDCDEDFYEAILSCIFDAYINNIEELTDLEVFFNYLKSAETKRVLLRDSINVLKVGKTPKKFKASLNYCDLKYKFYSPTSIEIELECNCDCEIEIYKLVEII